MTNLLSAVNILALSLSVIIVIAAVVVATTPSAAILLNSNGSIILAKKIPLAMNLRFLINWVVLLFATILAIVNWMVLLLEETVIIISDQRTAFLLKKKFRSN